MLLALVYSLLKPKYSGYNIYCHNLSRFDGIFLFKILVNLNELSKGKYTNKLTPIYNKESGNMINLRFNYSSFCFST
jgi:hypothetical protein